MNDAAAPCAACIDLRARLTNIYHLTLNGGDAAGIVRAIRAASGPGAPAPARLEYPYTGSVEHGRCGVDCIACAAGAPPREKSNA